LQDSDPAFYPFFLCSSASGTPQGRFDILMAAPGDALWLDGGGALKESGGLGSQGTFLHALDRWWRDSGLQTGDSHLPFTGGWFVFLAYELASQVEPVLNLAAHPDLPQALAVRIPMAVIHDRLADETWIVAEPGQEKLVGRIESDLLDAVAVEEPGEVGFSALTEDPPEAYIAAVVRAKEYIAAGDIYQANLARSWRAEITRPVSPAKLFAKLSRTNPGPFSALAKWGDTWILSSSPERLVASRDGWVQTRPIAGTRPRGRTPEQDGALMKELIGHPKERAEHVMLIDLERNDLGRVCKAGTVRVDEYMVLETYAHVHHIVSNVRGELLEGVSPGEVIAAVFPGGTITGCPKVRCMQIIQELETGPRGAYTGSLGYLNHDGSMDLNILIRTLVQNGRSLSFSAGAGIVSDSVPEAELEETRAKAMGLRNALSRWTER
jgi:anthranilate synthase component 1